MDKHTENADASGIPRAKPASAAPENAAPENAAPENAAPENAAPENAAPENAAPKNAGGESAPYREPGAESGDPAQMKRTWRNHHLMVLAMSLIAVGGAFLLEFHDDALGPVGVSSVRFPRTCASKRLFEVDCPGCGLTRSFVSAARGNVADAWRYNRAGVLWMAFLALQIPYRLWALVGRKGAVTGWAPRAGLLACWLLLGFLALNWVFNLVTGHTTP